MPNPALPSDVRMHSGDTLRRTPGLSMAFLTFAACLEELTITEDQCSARTSPLHSLRRRTARDWAALIPRSELEVQNAGDRCNSVFS